MCLIYLSGTCGGLSSCLLLAGSEVDPNTRCHCFWISKKDIKAEGVLLQVFSLNVAKARLETDELSIISSENYIKLTPNIQQFTYICQCIWMHIYLECKAQTYEPLVT